MCIYIQVFIYIYIHIDTHPGGDVFAQRGEDSLLYKLSAMNNRNYPGLAASDRHVYIIYIHYTHICMVCVDGRLKRWLISILCGINNVILAKITHIYICIYKILNLCACMIYNVWIIYTTHVCACVGSHVYTVHILIKQLESKISVFDDILMLVFLCQTRSFSFYLFFV